jgi:peptide/nickel transport system substrate-binding protein
VGGRAALLLAAVALAACTEVGGAPGERAAGSGAERPVAGDTLVEATIADISGLIPNLTSDGASHDVGNLLYNGLVRADRELNIQGDLAESWTFSPDCLSLTFRLRDTVRWHDGRPFTADDVVFTHEAMVHPRTPSPYKDDFQAVQRVEALDPRTVRVSYARPYAKALQTWSMWMLPRHRLQRYVEEGRLREAPEHRQAPVGTGAYRFREWRPGEKIVLTANGDYYEGPPYLSRIVYRVIPSQATVFLELKARGVDIANVTALQYTRQTEYPAFRKAYRKYRYAEPVYTYFGLNHRDPRFADRRVRQAFAHAIDRQALVEGVRYGLAREATGPYKPGTWVYNPGVRRYPYDPARARQLLAEAGWTETNADGLLVKEGRPFTFTVLTNQGNDERKKVAEIIQAALRDVGVGVEIRVIEWAALLKEYVKKRRFEALVLGWGIGLDPDQYAIWHSSKTGPDDFNTISYANPEVDALLERGRSTCFQAERKQHYDRLQEILAEDQPLIFLYFRDALPIVSSRVHGIEESPNGIRFNFTEWFVPLSLQRYTAG